jgi:very-short-patch-repair endonuclease
MEMAHNDLGWICPVCGAAVSTARALISHHKTEHGHTVCKHCGRSFARSNSCLQHERACENKRIKSKNKHDTMRWNVENGNRKLISGHAWNKGLTADTDDRVKKSRETLKRGYETGRLIPVARNRKMPEETKQKLSAKMKQFCAEHPDRIPYVLNHHSHGDSYPERYFKHLLNLYNIQYVQNYHVCGFFLDFANTECKRYIEIDGEQHYTDPRIVEHDIARTQQLRENGWECVCRVRWSVYQRLSKEEKVKYVANMVNQFTK